MSIFICEKCGKLDNTALNNNYWHAHLNQYLESVGRKIDIAYKPEFLYFENHVCCSDCCDGIIYKDNSGKIQIGDWDIRDKEHWTKYGKETLLEWEKRKDGSMVNASKYFKVEKDS